MKNINKKILLIGKIGLAVLLLIILFKSNLINLSLLKNASHRLDLLIAAIICCFLGILLQGIRWKFLLSAANIHLGWKAPLQLYLIGSFFSIYLPGAAGGDAIRGIYIYRILASGKGTAILSMIADRLFSLFGLLSLAGAIYLFFPIKIVHESLLAQDGKLTIHIILLVILIAAAMTVVTLFIQRRNLSNILPNWARRLIQPVLSLIHLYQTRWGTIILCWIISIFASGIAALGIVAIAAIFSFSPPPSITVIAGVYANLSSAIPITPGGVGIGEAIFAKFCTDLLGQIAPFATIYFIFRLCMLIANIPGFLAYILFDLSMHKKKAITLQLAQ